MNSMNLRDIGTSQRLLIWGFLAGVLGVVPVLLFVTVPFLWYCIWRVASALQLHIAVKLLCLILVVMPLVSVVVLLVLNGMATKALKRAGIKVGLFGPKLTDLPA